MDHFWRSRRSDFIDDDRRLPQLWPGDRHARAQRPTGLFFVRCHGLVGRTREHGRCHDRRRVPWTLGRWLNPLRHVLPTLTARRRFD